MAMVGGIQVGDSNDGNDPQGRTLQRVAILIFIVLFLGLSVVNFLTFRCRSHIMQSEQPILKATTVALPLLAPRLLFALLAVFQIESNVFSTISQGKASVIASAFMVTLPEFIIAAVVLTAGFKVPSLAESKAQAKDERETEMGA